MYPGIGVDSFRVAWAAGFFDGEGCISIGKPINKRLRKDGTGYRHTWYQLQAIVAQRNRRPLEVLVGLFGGNITIVKIHGSSYFYLRMHGPKAMAMLQRLLPFLVLKQEQAELAIRFQQYYDATRKPRRSDGRSLEETAMLDSFYEQSKQFNMRYKQKDWTEMEKGEVLQ